MDYIINRAKGLFQYGDLDGETRSSSDTNTIDVEQTGILSANAKVRRSRRCIWMSTLVCGVLAIIIIATAVKNKHHLKAAADALMDSINSSSEEAATLDGAPMSSLRKSTNQYRFQDFLRYSYYPDDFNGTWISDSEILYKDSKGGISISNVDTLVTKTVISPDQVRQINPVSYTFSSDRSYLLIKTVSVSKWRRSSYGAYMLVKMEDDRPNSRISTLMPPDASEDASDLRQFIRYVSWGPVGNALVYVDFENNLYYRHSAEAQDVQLTSTGKEDVIFNGIPDWVTEEEVLEDNKAIYWSPDGRKVAYGVYNDTNVEIVKLPRYGNWKTKGTNYAGYGFLNYFHFDDFRYPKVSSRNPTVSLWLADVGPPGEAGPIKQHNIAPPVSLIGTEHHFTFVRWAGPNTLAVNWMNRIQNKTAINMCDIPEGHQSDLRCNDVFVMNSEDGWVDYKLDIMFNKYKEGKRFLAILPASSIMHRYRQIFLIDVENNSRTLMTRGRSEVTKILEWTREDHVYYIGTEEDKPGTRQLFRLELGQPEPDCLTCHHKKMMQDLKHRPDCEYVDVQMSKNASFYMMNCKGPGVPYSCLQHTPTNRVMSLWTDNTRLENRWGLLDTASKEFLEVPVPGTDQTAKVYLYLPSSLSLKKGKKYPLLVDMYGGPGFQWVDKKWSYHEFGAYIASAFDVVYAKIDPRGSGLQGDAWRHAIYRQLGTYEVTDTIHVTKYLQDNLDYIDANRTGIWGWSYGGYLTLSALVQDTNNVFRCGASVAPVVRWELYDTYYTERYMSTLEDNPRGYEASSPLNKLENLRGKQYMLMHGTHDDNVHYQQSMLLSAALEEKDILFRQQSYPDQDHGIQHYRRHLNHNLIDFFIKDCFDMEVGNLYKH